MPSLLHLTPRHFAVYDFILKHKEDHDGIAPTVQEIKEACDIPSTSQVRPVLNSLVLLGMIECDYGKGKSRMISVPGARWLPPSNSEHTSPVGRGARGKSVRISSPSE